MSFRPGNMTLSSRLANVIAEYETHFADRNWHDAFDMVSPGDNDCIGPDLIDPMAMLSIAAMNHCPNPVIFYASGNAPDGVGYCYYQFGRDEDDTLARVFKKSFFLPTFMVQVEARWRECVLREGHYVHALDSGWKIEVCDPSIAQTYRQDHGLIE